MRTRLLLGIGFAVVLNAGSQTPVPDLRAYRDRAMSRDGDIRRGKELFFADKCGCSGCHTVDGSAGKAGPDLFAAGDKVPRVELIRAILEPSAAIAVGYGTTFIETKSGDEYSGIIKQVTDAWTELMLPDGKTVRINTSEIKEQRGSNISLMPEGLQAATSLQEFTDLIEYVASLKQPEAAMTMNRGMPAVIAELPQLVRLVPFFDEHLRFPHAFVHKPGDVRSGLVWFGQLPGASNTFVAVHQTGKIWLIDKRKDGDTKSLFVDVAAEIFNERGPNGLLGIAFHPLFRENRKYYLKHQVFEDRKIATVLEEREAAPDWRHDSGKPARRLLKIVSVTQDHSGGCIAFGPDGFLYLGMGDTGPQQDPQGHGQDMQTLLAKIIRIDVDKPEAGLPYAIPADNPFRGRSDARPEIWALGFREPWRFSFDSVTGDLWVGDVGQDRVEEVAIVRRGENHGWNVFEGFEPFSNRYRKEGVNYVAPVFAYKRKYGNSITGGFVYRGDKRSSFYGVYICGDYTSKHLFGVTQENRVLKTVRQIGESPQFIASFGTDEQGNIYVVGYEGMIYQIDFTSTVFDATPNAAQQQSSAVK
jgi:putative heme-binding domain-containing protein